MSLRNIMCRIEEGINAKGQQERKVYGVLTDYDLSSWTEHLKGDYTRTSQQRTGTPPYMAQELLEPKCTNHLYRHDVESLFYVMLLMCGRHTFSNAKDEEATRRVVMRNDFLPYKDWFGEQNYEKLGSIKRDFILQKKAIYVSEDFKDFHQWLTDIRFCFGEGFTLKLNSRRNQERPSWKLIKGAESAPLDDETLGDNVGYSTIIDSIPHLEGELKGLIIRYNPYPKGELEGLDPLQ